MYLSVTAFDTTKKYQPRRRLCVIMHIISQVGLKLRKIIMATTATKAMNMLPFVGISGSHGIAYDDNCLLGCYAM
jgi:hypothetical protein